MNSQKLHLRTKSFSHFVQGYFSLMILPGVFLLAASCSDSTSGVETEPTDLTDPNMASVEIGQAGGDITSVDGLVLIHFPSGALNSLQTVTIRLIDSDEAGEEFDEIAADIGIHKAYRLGPGGLSFDTPVTVQFNTGQIAEQAGDSVEVDVALLLTSEDGEAVALDSLRTETDEQTGAVTLTGEMNHFSPLVATESLSHQLFKIERVPDQLEVHETFIAEVFHLSRGRNNNEQEPTPVSYRDHSKPPLQPNFEPLNQKLTVTQADLGIVFATGQFEYSCTEKGTGLFSAESISYSLNNIWISLSVRKSVECVGPPAPVLKYPANGATDVELSVSLEWESVSGATSYQAQLTEKGTSFDDESALEAEGTNTRADVENLAPETTYIWRVRAIKNGVSSDWSEVWEFTTKEGEPTVHFGDLKTCVEHGTGRSEIFWRWAIAIELIESYFDITITMVVKLPNGNEAVINTTPMNAQLLLMQLDIFTFGVYQWKITGVSFQGKAIPFMGDATEGEVSVDYDEQNPGECNAE